MTKVIYTVKEAAALLGTNVDYVHRLRKAGVLPFIKLGSYKIRKEALDEFLKTYEGYDLTNPEKIEELKNAQ